MAPLLLLEKTIIFTCYSLSVFAGPFAESVDWFPVGSFFALLQNNFVSMPSVFLMPVFSEVGILYWRDTDLFVTKK